MAPSFLFQTDRIDQIVLQLMSGRTDRSMSRWNNAASNGKQFVVYLRLVNKEARCLVTS